MAQTTRTAPPTSAVAGLALGAAASAGLRHTDGNEQSVGGPGLENRWVMGLLGHQPSLTSVKLGCGRGRRVEVICNLRRGGWGQELRLSGSQTE